ncbi:MAG TPA: MoaD/ThiS family protein [Candidatus Nanoarchaeia archaeon]|nr:MoaD/ThiS family protein [Candidatus Nanoarchaeia archaeon]
MEITVFIEKENSSKAAALADKSTVGDLLVLLKINPVTSIVSRNDEIIVEDDELHDGDSLKIISVISGG